MNLALLVAAVGVAIGLVGLPLTWANWKRGRSDRTSGRFVRISEHVHGQQAHLHARAWSGVRPEWANDEVPMLTCKGWILPAPISVEAIRLDWDDNPPITDQSNVARIRARKLMPQRNDGDRYPTYSDALVQLTGRSHLYDGYLYRPISINTTADTLRIRFTQGRYFDHLDTTEVLAFEAASRDLAGRGSLEGSYRRWLSDPFDLTRRSTGLGTVTLTIRVDAGRAGFYMHKRDAARVVVGPGVVHTIPAGEFTPSDIGLDAMRADFDLWRTVMREFAEEFLDVEEAYGRGGRPLDYEHDWPFDKLTRARATGQIRPYVLGIGLDALTWKPELLLVCLIDGPAFDAIFATMTSSGREGTIIVGPHGHGIPFDFTNISNYVRDSNTRGAAKACLNLAWRHRALLGLSDDEQSPPTTADRSL
ncbi:MULTISPECIES: hypothetical protein [unclassified Crossiella]|uniref:hypothetical protein n=1 Tax=unclassified Crossiella TaxID=2620835 RepID=UPI001FFF94AA|nr:MULTISPECIES: hypothetical protein [unclassified Crossiella]MCK2241853.1 hypothetical protein [Crossiella sp. S99.2]MCK2255756.1 hypothetical protein [Crossiella sp. S99.1]